MGRTQLDTFEITPDQGTDYARVRIPDRLARRASAMAHLEGEPSDLGSVVDLHDEHEVFSLDGDLTWQDMLRSPEQTRHRVTIGDETVHTYCVLDALILPFLLDERVEILSRSPHEGELVEVLATPDRLETALGSAVVSVGACDAEPEDPSEVEAETTATLLRLAQTHSCPAINAFPDEEAYRAWAPGSGAVTVMLTLAQAYTMARDLAAALRR